MVTAAAAHVLPARSVNVLLAGNWSFPATLNVLPVEPPGDVAVSSTASMIVAVVVAVLFAVLLSLVAPVVPVIVNDVSVVSLPPDVPGAVYVYVQLIDDPFAKLANGSDGQDIALTVPTFALGTHVGFVAAEGPLFVHVSVRPVSTWPGLTVAGTAPNVTLMSAAPAVTVSVAVSHTVWFGLGAHT